MSNNFFITVLYGSDQIRKIYNNEALSEEEISQYVKTYSFETKKELQAFTLGIEESQGWLEVLYFEGIKIQSEEARPLRNVEIKTSQPQRPN